MSHSATAAPLARVALARDPRRMLAAPALLVLLGAATAALGPIVGGALLFGLVAVGGALAAIGLWLAIRILSLRLVVEPDYLHLKGVGTDRRYHLIRGDMNRLATAGPRKVNLRVRLGSLGWAVGRTALAAGESVEVIRLAATPSVILVPTERGRVAVAVASEAAFVDALRAAAHTRAERRISAAGAPLATLSPAGQPAPALQPAPAFPPAPAFRGAPTFEPMPAPQPLPAFERPTQPRPLTGIERMWLEDRLARERRAAITGARDEQAAASFTASVAALAPAGATVVPSLHAAVPAPAATVASAAVVSAAVVSTVVPAVSAIPAAATAVAAAATATPSAPPRTFPGVIPRRRPSRTMARRVARPDLTPGLVLIGTPLVGALFSWLLALVTGATPGQAGLDPLAAALLLCGPVAALAIFLAHSRWPRLAGLSSVAAILALLLITRSVIS
ncbi:MAG: hypothetical protein ACRDE9_07720 [Candidatus Limnocylindria bacterium]